LGEEVARIAARIRARWARGRNLAQGRKVLPDVEFYLAASEAAFRYQGLVVLQVQLVKRIDALPLTRDYMADAEQQLLRQDDAIDARPRMVGE
jgi:cyclopropane-fatty-acyl-phospholipid synthase